MNLFFGNGMICITHFPQVANLACHHLKIYKEEDKGRTITNVLTLDHLSQPHELARMSGIKLKKE